MNIVHSDGDLCNHGIAKLPTYRGGRRTDTKLSKLCNIIYLARFHPSEAEHTGTNIREALMRKKNREVSAWSYNSSVVSNRAHAHAAHAIFNH